MKFVTQKSNRVPLVKGMLRHLSPDFERLELPSGKLFVRAAQEDVDGDYTVHVIVFDITDPWARRDEIGLTWGSNGARMGLNAWAG